MDTWATSSLTPQIVTGWVDDPDLFERTFPMDLRPQGPEIIRTWLFDTVVRARFEHGVLPWSDTTINGWVLDPDRKKMSKSKGNVVTPMPLVEEYGPDALRYWACNGRPGGRHRGRLRDHEDRPQARDQDPQRVEVHAQHRRRDARGRTARAPATISARSRTRSTSRCSRCSPISSTRRPPRSTPSTTPRALERIERFFWSFCDDYVELVKGRAYGGVGDGGGRVGRGRAAHRAVDAAALVRAVHAVRDRRGVVVVRRRARSTARRGRTRRRLRLAGGDPLVFEVDRRGARRGAQGEVGAEALADDAGRRGSSCTTPPSGSRRSRAPSPTCAKPARSPSSHDRDRAPSCGSRSSSRRPTARELPRRPVAAGLARRAREPGDRRRRAGTHPRARRAHARAHRHAAAVSRLAAARVPGDPPHRHERQDDHDAHDHRAARRPSATRSARTRARTSNASTSASSATTSRSPTTSSTSSCASSRWSSRSSGSIRRTSRW